MKGLVRELMIEWSEVNKILRSDQWSEMNDLDRGEFRMEWEQVTNGEIFNKLLIDSGELRQDGRWIIQGDELHLRSI